MRGRIWKDKQPVEKTWDIPDGWPYMFTVVVTSPYQEKARETAEAYHEFLHDAWGHRNQDEMADVRFETSPVELM